MTDTPRRPGVHTIRLDLDDAQFKWLYEYAAKRGHALTASQALRNFINECRQIDEAMEAARRHPLEPLQRGPAMILRDPTEDF